MVQYWRFYLILKLLEVLIKSFGLHWMTLLVTTPVASIAYPSFTKAIFRMGSFAGAYRFTALARWSSGRFKSARSFEREGHLPMNAIVVR